jgi:hypothetical protein
MQNPYTRYYWKQLTADGRLIDAEWANPEGYEHSDQATVHFHMRFSVDPYASSEPFRPQYQLIKLYGLRG